jgi:ABC-type phosphate transport system substrate-binding protein
MATWSVAGASSAAQAEPSGDRKTSTDCLAIVVDRRNPATDISMGQLREILFGDRKWWTHNRPITLAAMRRGTAERQAILQTIYKMDDVAFDKYFFFEVYRGELANSPTTLQTPDDVKKFVSSKPGSIGYLRTSDLDGSVKVLRINGLLPGDDGYPLRLRRR